MGINQYPTKYVSDIDVVVSETAPATPNVGDIWVDTSAEVPTYDLLSSKIAGPNLLHNGAFNINQRAFTSTTTSGVYGFDRWQMWSDENTLTTYSAQSFDSGSTLGAGPIYQPKSYARMVTAGGQNATSAYSILIQKMEDPRTAAGEAVTVSFWARAGSGTPKVAVEFVQNFGGGGSPSADVNFYVGQVTLSTSWTRYSVSATLPSVVGKTRGTDGKEHTRLMLWTSGGSTFNSRTGSLGVQTATIDFWGVQVERGSTATGFEQKKYEQELAECQRFYYASPASVVLVHNQYNSGNTSSSVYQFPVTMRGTPTVTVYDDAGTINKLSWSANGGNIANNVTPPNMTVNAHFWGWGSGGMPTSSEGFSRQSFTASADL